MNKLIKQSGFTLVELAMVLGIVSVLAIGSVTLFSEQKVNVDMDMSQSKLEAAKVALIRFAEQNHYLPCPDINVEGETGFGFENRVSAVANIAAVSALPGTPAQVATATAPFIPAVSAIPAQPARTETVDICVADNGTIPFEMIDLSKAGVEDVNKSLFHYAVTVNVDVAANLANCPVDSACFFNRNTVPAFNYSTEPVSGALGVNNLTVCSGSDCSGANLLGDGLIAVLLAYNQNNFSVVGSDEAENQDNDQIFIQSNYSLSEDDYFDDLLVTISGAELKKKEEKTYQKESVAEIAGGTAFSGNDLLNMGDNSLGGSGTNVGSDDVIWDSVNQVFDFGESAANQEIVLTYKTRAVGSWDQPLNSSSTTTSDTATVTNNGAQVEEYKYNFKDDTQDGVQAVSFVAGFTGNLETRDVNGNTVIISIVKGQTYNTYTDYWVEEREFILQTDSTGQVDLEFAVGTTATYETIDFTDIELVYYNVPPPIPSFPSVKAISGISQTEGL